MFSKLLPRSTNFFDFFDKQSAIIVSAAVTFHQITSEATLTIANTDIIHNLEHAADKVTHECSEELQKSFITPIAREDIYQLITTMDDIIDSIDEAFEKIIIYKVFPIMPEAIQFAEILVKAAKLIEKAVAGLQNLENVALIRSSCNEIHACETEADVLLRESMARLFDSGKDTLTIIKWKEIYENLERATDHCKHVADQVQAIVLEYS